MSTSSELGNGVDYTQRMKVYVYKLCTIFTCVSRIHSTDLYVFPHTWGSRGIPFFRLMEFCCCHLYLQIDTTISIVNTNLYIQIGITYKLVQTNLYEIIHIGIC